MSASWLLTTNPENVKEVVKRAMEFGVPSRSRLFINFLLTCAQNPEKIESKIKSLMRLGWSKSEVLSMIRKQANLLRNSKEIIQHKYNFLTKDVGMDPAFVARNPVLLMLSLNKRLVPRHRVLMELKAAGLPEGSRSYTCILTLTEQKFLEKFVFPNLDRIPNLDSMYTAITGVKLPAKRGFFDRAVLLRTLGFSESEISEIMKEPKCVAKSEEKLRGTVDFLITHGGLDRSYIASHPWILRFSMEWRLIPRCYVIKCLELKGLVKNKNISKIMVLKEMDFMEQFINPYEGIFPGLAENYDCAHAGRALKFRYKGMPLLK